MAKREDVNVELTVVVDFGEQYGQVTLVEDLEMPFVEAALKVRHEGASLLYGAVLKAATLRPSMLVDIFQTPVRYMKAGDKPEPKSK
jgi:hypothetical protein